MAYSTINTTYTGSNNYGIQVGYNSGNIEVNNHLPETPPSPSLFVPFCRDSDFVTHGTLLDQIYEKCSMPASRVALVSLGGVGKSQLAIEHCYRTADRSLETWVFWVHASNIARIEQGYQDIAEQLVYNWLRNEKNGKWLLVLDNVDDIAALSLSASNNQKVQVNDRNGTRPRYLSSYLPQSKNGSVLVTSRTRSVALQLVENNNIIAIEPMGNTDAQSLLQKKLGGNIDNDKIAELAAALEFMPLALVQAAAYIRQRAPRYSVQQYLEQFYRNDRKRTNLLDYDGDHLRRDEEAKNSILITWQISFDHILHARRSAADLLSLMSFFDRQGIPQALIRTRSGTENEHGGVEAINTDDEHSDSDDNESKASVDDGFEEDILTLRNYSFIVLTTDTTTFDMHRLVQLATRKWLERKGQLERWKQLYIYNLCAEFPTGELENWAQCQMLFPHAKSAMAQPPDSEESRRQWALLLYKAAWYAWRKGSPSDAEELSKKSMKVTGKLLGKEHEDTLRSMRMVGRAISFAGRWKEAEELEVKVVETSSRVLGEEHPETLSSMANLASTYSDQGRWKEAEELNVQVMETRKRVVGEEHPQTLSSMNSLAFILEGQGRTTEAISLMENVLLVGEQAFGSQHPDILSSSKVLVYWRSRSLTFKEKKEEGMGSKS
ncbi:putative kinesin [Delitschia confertaspora ATCC 74209]|uniref:Kinesin n=1 Tax=Delitschia confertaspora ATCC 74209 TaxID=1513339 RepID=A0A9P4MMQ8_9PLEO|nr:putative kinesin [Delitschia confertaspora ATCC 74209]